ncbi:MAG: hypothetical protein ACRD03_12235 [Acidimicrobiales bacterium]
MALALAAGDGALVVEADPYGGDIAARARVPLEPGLLTMAAAGRHPTSPLPIHAQPLPSGAQAIVAPTDPHQASTALAAIASRLVPALRSNGTAFVDCGRWSPVTAVTELLASCDMVVMVAEPTVAGIEHVLARRDALRSVARRLAVLLVGDRPYGPGETEAALDLPLVGPFPVDPRGALDVYAGPPRPARKSGLCRAARSSLDRLKELTAPLDVPA